MVLPQKLFSGDYLLVYASDENNVVVFINPNPESADTLEAEMTNEEVDYTMGCDMMEEMEYKKG